MTKVTARNIRGMIIFSGVKAVDEQDIGVSSSNNAINEHEGKSVVDQSTRNIPNVALSFINSRSVTPDMNGEGPNHRGTFSKEYTVRHSDINWVHRGQGRYLPEDLMPTSSENFTPSQDLLMPSQRRSRRSRGSNTSEENSHESHFEARRLSPRATRLSSSYSLRRKSSTHEIPANDLREARLLRRTNQSTSSSADSLSADTIDEDNDKTYAKAFVDAHPDLQFKHCGNGFYKRLTAHSPTFLDTSRASRRTSSRSLTKSEVSAVDINTIHSSELKNYPGEKFRHCGNGYYRRASAVSQITSSGSAAVTERSASPYDPLEMSTDSYTKEQMLNYKKDHPNDVFIHRGNGRYKRINDVAIEAAHAATLNPEDKITYDKKYVDENPDEEFHHCGYGRYKRGPRVSRPSVVSNTEDGQELPTGLVTKEYVDEHPEFEFHHRGQGRYALGARPKGSPSDTEDNTSTKEVLFDREYVDAHPNETFHHRGQGRWAKGPPPPGSSNKMAVRGPGLLARTSTTSSTEAHYNEDELPAFFDLVKKEDGPAAWPHISWSYRGGGKWSRASKEDAEAESRRITGGSVKNKSRSNADTQDADSNASGGSTEQERPALKRKRSTLQSFESDDNNRSEQQSKASTPKLRLLTLEEDHVGPSDLPELYLDAWTPLGADDDDDQAARLLRQTFRPINNMDAFVKSLSKHDPAIRPTETLYNIAAHVQDALKQLQDEYLELDKITAPHARIPRKTANGGRIPIDPQIFEDRKEADLYDYQFDPKKIGYQDPDVQKINRDVDGRELRKRRKRGDLDTDTVDEAPLPRRTIKPVNRFDGVPGSTTRRSRALDKQGSLTPDRMTTPTRARNTPQGWNDSYEAPTSGRWKNHVPKRIRELRGNSAGPARADDEDSADEQGDVGSQSMTRGHSKGSDASPKKGQRLSTIIDSIEDDDLDASMDEQ